jgi:hypothetical protein
MRLIVPAATLVVICVSVGIRPVCAQTPPPRPTADAARWFATDGKKEAESTPESAASTKNTNDTKEKPPHYLRQTTCNIPFTVDASRAAPVELQLFVSLDRGQHWGFSAKSAPGNGTFAFRAVQDGEYWFALRTIEKSKQPVDPKSLAPGLKIVFDTQQPQLDFDLQSNNGEMHVTWKASDANLAPDTLKIEYQTSSQESWRLVRTEAPTDLKTREFSGSQTWRLDVPSDSIVVRAEVHDLAGNNQVVTRYASLDDRGRQKNTPVASSSKSFESSPAVDGSVTWPRNNTLPAPTKKPPVITRSELPPPKSANNSANANSLRNSRLTSSAEGNNESIDPGSSQSTNSSGNGLRADAESRVTPDEEPAPRIATPIADATAADAQGVQDAPREPDGRAENGESQLARDNVAPNATQGERPRMTSARRFDLDYEIDALGTASVEKVELWGTANGGRTWTRWLDDKDNESPIEVDVANDGVYGFRIVIIASNQLASPAPEAGEPADIWVQVDTVRPQVELISATYGDGEHVGQFDIRWQAADDGFSDRPITLSFSDKPSGPWNTIAAGLPNTGQYFWAVEPRIPRLIYLRIAAHDEAGNIGEHQIVDPISTTGLIPQGRIRGMRAAPPAERSAGRSKPQR